MAKVEGKVKAKIFRYNPNTDEMPTFKTYEVSWQERGNVLQLLKQIYEDQDGTLAFPYYACGFKFCNGCLMTINGIVTHGCMTLVDPGDEILLEPMKGYPIIRDLVVDHGRTFTSPEGYTYEISKGANVKYKGLFPLP